MGQALSYLRRQIMKILVVDDEEDVREIITEFIVENFDIDVLEASTGMEAINCLEGEKAKV